MHTSSLKALLHQLSLSPEDLERAVALWHEAAELIEEDDFDHDDAAISAALAVLVSEHTIEQVAEHINLSTKSVRAALEELEDILDLSPFDPRYSASASAPSNPMMQQLAGMLFEVCERSHDPLDRTIELPQIATTWTLLIMPLEAQKRPDELLVSLVDNHTKFVLDQRLVDASVWHVKRAVEVLVSVMLKSGIRPDDIMIQSCEIVHELRERLDHVHIATSVTDGSHLEDLIASFTTRFAQPATLFHYFPDEPSRLPEQIDTLHEHATTFWERETWQTWPPDVMLDCQIAHHSWLVSMLDGSGGRIGLTMFDASEQETKHVGTQRILVFMPCEQIDHATLAALSIRELTPIDDNYYALFADEGASSARADDYAHVSALLEGLNAYAALAPSPPDPYTFHTHLGELIIVPT